jgi:hypothetical protein
MPNQPPRITLRNTLALPAASALASTPGAAQAAPPAPPASRPATSIAGDFTRWVERRELPKPTPALVAPPGDPFGWP